MSSKAEKNEKNETVRAEIDKDIYRKLKLISLYRGNEESINDVLKYLVINEFERIERDDNGFRKFLEEDNQE